MIIKDYMCGKKIKIESTSNLGVQINLPIHDDTYIVNLNITEIKLRV